MADARAKTKRLQKRRKVFVNEYSDGLLLLATKLSRKEAVKGRCGLKARTVCFIESRPGDVVLSREQAAALRLLADRKKHSDEALDWENVPALPSCSKCGGSGKYTWEDGHNGDEHESACPCTSKAIVTVSSALAPFRGGR